MIRIYRTLEYSEESDEDISVQSTEPERIVNETINATKNAKEKSSNR